MPHSGSAGGSWLEEWLETPPNVIHLQFQLRGTNVELIVVSIGMGALGRGAVVWSPGKKQSALRHRQEDGP